MRQVLISKSKHVLYLSPSLIFEGQVAEPTFFLNITQLLILFFTFVVFLSDTDRKIKFVTLDHTV